MRDGPNGIAWILRLAWERRPRRTVRSPGGYRVQFEHPTQLLASTFLRALATADHELVWARLSRESRGLLEGLYASRAGIALARAAGVDDDASDARLVPSVAPLLEGARAVAGGVERLGASGVSAARLVDRLTAFVLVLADFPEERIVREEEWSPSHLLAFVRESGEWLVDLGKTAELSAEAGLPDPLGSVR